MIKTTYLTESNIDLPAAALVAININRNTRNSDNSYVERVQDPDTQVYSYVERSEHSENDNVNYQVSVFKDEESFDAGATQLEGIRNSGLFMFSYSDVAGATLREKVYNHMLSLEMFDGATIVEGQEL